MRQVLELNVVAYARRIRDSVAQASHVRVLCFFPVEDSGKGDNVANEKRPFNGSQCLIASELPVRHDGRPPRPGVSRTFERDTCIGLRVCVCIVDTAPDFSALEEGRIPQ
jgi:hypothetical protein